jgi:hypothetical protein
MSRLSKTETYAALWLASQGSDVASISKELKIEEKSIVSILEKHNSTNTDKIKTGSGPTKQNKQKTLMVNETAVKKNKSVSVMTEAASQRNDQVIKNMRSTNNNKNIFRPHNG